jgi:fructose-1-phosphate kinase PfkB-like protein
MTKLLLGLWFTSTILLACNEPASNNSEATVNYADSILPTPTVADDQMIVAINDVSDAEMKDDSVFADGSIPTTWEVAGITDVKGLKLFLKQVQQWVMSNNKEQLAAAVQYPINNIKNKDEMIAAYDQYFTKEVKLSFAMINFSQIFRNAKGVMMAGGKVWIQPVNGTYKIFSINP